MSAPSQILLLRADADPRMGTGHVMRCLALAQAWQEAGGQTLLVTHDIPSALEDRLDAENVSIVDLEATSGSAADADRTVSLAREQQAEWIVIDGYHFDGSYQAILKEAGLCVLALDDYGHAGRQSVDLILNQNMHATVGLYADREHYTRLLLGPRFALLRREFLPRVTGAVQWFLSQVGSW